MEIRWPAGEGLPQGTDSGLVYIVEDDAAVRRALTRLMRSTGLNVTSFALAEDFLIGASPEMAPACLLADLRLPGLSGLELSEVMQEQGFDLPTVFISGRADLSVGVEAMKRGAVDFLEKPLSETALLNAIVRALDRHRRLRAQQAERTSLSARFQSLTPREREVFNLIVTGLLNKQVGAELGTSEKTVKVHRGRVMQKMEAGSLADLVRMADRLAQWNA